MRNYKKLVVALVLVLMAIVSIQNVKTMSVASAQEGMVIELGELKDKYQKLNDELWEVKNSRDLLNNRINEIESALLKLSEIKPEQVKHTHQTTQETTQEKCQWKKGKLLYQ